MRRLNLSTVLLVLLIFAGGIICSLPVAAQTQKRIALLIGNGAYQEVSILHNPKRDVSLIGKVFQDAGFETVTMELDLDRAKMLKAIRAFEGSIQNADIGVIYYAGHGIEVNGQNFLIPTDAKLASDKDVEDEAISLDRLIKALDGVTRLRLVILDACRDNPFVPKMTRSTGTRSISRGLAQIEPVNADTLIAFAAKAGTVAQDGSGGNSPYSQAIARHITTKNLDIRIALGRIRDDVLKATNRAQEPFLYGSLGGDILTLGSNEAISPQETIQQSSNSTRSVIGLENNSTPTTLSALASSNDKIKDQKSAQPSKPEPVIVKPQNKNAGEFWRVRLNVSQGIQNVRSGPGTQHEILFTIPAGLGGISIDGCKEAERAGASNWCLVKWQTKTGWLAFNGLEPDPQKR